MAMLVKDSSYTDKNGNQIVWSDAVKKVVFYSTEGESWDRSGGGTTSWFIENTLPYDAFSGYALDDDKWGFFTYRGTVSGTVDNRLFLTISGSDARGGITSSGRWKLSGDFDIRLYLDELSYYNEYRGSTATGLTISVDEANKYRVSKYFYEDTQELGFSSDYVDTYELRYALWTQDAFSTFPGEDDITTLRLTREGDAISAYVSSPTGFVKVGGGVSGGSWSEDVDVEIEVETERFNYYSANILAFSVSGTLAQSTNFSTPYRGPEANFPDRTLLVVDDKGMSIVDESDLSLWMRFINSSDYMFKYTNCSLAASEGCIYYTTNSGLLCLDFPNDKAVWYTDEERRESTVGLAMRNFKSPFSYVDASSFILENTVTDVDATKVGADSFVVSATTSGIGLLINGNEEKTESAPSGNVRETRFGADGSLYWGAYDPTTSRGKLYYRDSVSSLVSDGYSTFTPSGHYSSDTSPVSLTSEYINDISIVTGDARRVVLSNKFGIDYIVLDTLVSFGPESQSNPVGDPTFISEIGVTWKPLSVSVFNAFDIAYSSYWYTFGSNSLSLGMHYNSSISIGDYGGVYQEVDLSGVDQLYFDFYLVNNAPVPSKNYLTLQVRVDGQVLFSQADSFTSFVQRDNAVDVSQFSGTHTLMFVVSSQYEGSSSTYTTFYVDNIRVIPVEADYPIIPTVTHEVLESLLVYNTLERKIFFVTNDGYGAIDVDSKTLDEFIPITNVVPSSTLISADYVEYIDVV